MDFELSEQQQEWQRTAREFASTELCPDMIQRDRDEVFDAEAWRSCARFGIQGMPVPEEFGGLGLPLGEVVAVFEGLGQGARDQGLLFSLNAHLWTNSIPLLLYGTDEQKQRYLPGLSDGSLVGANAATEPDAGSDVFSMRCRAERDGDHYVLNGTKMFVTNAPVADLIVTYATLEPSRGPLGITGFVVERDTPGVTISPPMSKMGLRTSPLGEVVFDAARIPVANRLGREGRGVEVFECSMEWERGCILASCLGVMRRQLQQCIAHVRQRKQFGKAIGKFQSVANRIVDMKVRLDACRPLVYRIAWLKEQGKDALQEASVAKLAVSEAYVRSCQDALETFGGYGYMTEQEVERDLRDALASKLYSGTSDIQRNIIARGLGL